MLEMQEKLEARKMLENAADSHQSSAPLKMRAIILYERNKVAMRTVYSEAASTQAEHSSGDAPSRSPVVHRGFRSN